MLPIRQVTLQGALRRHAQFALKFLILRKSPMLTTSQKSLKQIVPPTQAETDDLKIKKAWEIALAPAKSLPMNAFMMYMSGNTLQIFSIMLTWMLFMNPIKAISNLGNTFAKFDGETTRSRLLVVKLAFLALQILTIGF